MITDRTAFPPMNREAPIDLPAELVTIARLYLQINVLTRQNPLEIANGTDAHRLLMRIGDVLERYGSIPF